MGFEEPPEPLVAVAVAWDVVGEGVALLLTAVRVAVADVVMVSSGWGVSVGEDVAVSVGVLLAVGVAAQNMIWDMRMSRVQVWTKSRPASL
ncbi:MAG: hypothetical protein HC804_04535 [Anaerolineae bacterium]|nr:hypothetical protein [Anaerolineae bacterium]